MTIAEQQGVMGHRGSPEQEQGGDGDAPSLDPEKHTNNGSMAPDDLYLQHRRLTDFREPYRWVAFLFQVSRHHLSEGMLFSYLLMVKRKASLFLRRKTQMD